MKLELKHLAPYLPYHIQCKLSTGEIEYLMGLEYGFADAGIPGDVPVALFGEFGAVELQGRFKPLLRPLSDLTKEKCQEMGLKYIYTYTTKRGTEIYVVGGFEGMDALTIIYEEYQKLFEQHYDVSNLIPQGLAIAK